MRGDNARVVDAFCVWVSATGSEVQRQVAFCDVRAVRGDQVMYAEAKARTAATGLDIDTMYGQLLRRMPAEAVGRAEFAVVVPSSALSAALRVPSRVREPLGVEVYSVDEQGAVAQHNHLGQEEPPTPWRSRTARRSGRVKGGRRPWRSDA